MRFVVILPDKSHYDVEEDRYESIRMPESIIFSPFPAFLRIAIHDDCGVAVVQGTDQRGCMWGHARELAAGKRLVSRFIPPVICEVQTDIFKRTQSNARWIRYDSCSPWSARQGHEGVDKYENARMCPEN